MGKYPIPVFTVSAFWSNVTLRFVFLINSPFPMTYLYGFQVIVVYYKLQ